MNIRSSAYFIARSRSDCPSCGKNTEVLALAVPRDHEVWTSDGWDLVPCEAFIFDLEELPEPVRRRLGPGRGADAVWTNQCRHCGELIDDQSLFCEPGAAFCPDTAAGAGKIHLTAVREPLVVAAAGHAPDPPLLELALRD